MTTSIKLQNFVTKLDNSFLDLQNYVNVEAAITDKRVYNGYTSR